VKTHEYEIGQEVITRDGDGEWAGTVTGVTEKKVDGEMTPAYTVRTANGESTVEERLLRVLEYKYPIGEQVFCIGELEKWIAGTITKHTTSTWGMWNDRLRPGYLVETDKGQVHKTFDSNIVSFKERKEAILRKQNLIEKAKLEYGDRDINDGLMALSREMDTLIGPSQVAVLAQSFSTEMTEGVD